MTIEDNEAKEVLEDQDDVVGSHSRAPVTGEEQMDCCPASGQAADGNVEDLITSSADLMSVKDDEAGSTGEDALTRQSEELSPAFDTDFAARSESTNTTDPGEVLVSPRELAGGSLTSSMHDLYSSVQESDRTEVLSQARTVQVQVKRKPVIPNFDLGSSSDEE
eukprot:3217877-Rhodomonas_salina.1